MSDLLAQRILAGWDAARGLASAERDCALLASALAGGARGEIACWPIGERDRCLVQLRCAWFGPEATGLVTCATCGARMELEISLERMLSVGDDPAPTLELTADGYRALLRRPSSIDLSAVADVDDPGRVRRMLFERCVDEAALDGCPIDAAGLPDQLMDLAALALAAADPMAHVELSGACPECGAEGAFDFDIGSFLWAEVEAEAVRLLYEVHALASAYGWSESEILALSSGRRRLYLEMAGR